MSFRTCNKTNILLYDGHCLLCNQTVKFIIRHDPKSKFKFAALNSYCGQLLLEQLDLPLTSTNTVIYICDNRFYTKSTAVLRVLRELTGLWPLLYGLSIIPRFMRDWCYDFVAKHRNLIIKTNNSCLVPTSEIRSRLLK